MFVKQLTERIGIDTLRFLWGLQADLALPLGELSPQGTETKDVIVQAMAEIDEGRAEGRLEKLLENKWKSLKDDPQGKLKLIRFALGRGYGYDDVSSMLDKVCRDENQ